MDNGRQDLRVSDLRRQQYGEEWHRAVCGKTSRTSSTISLRGQYLIRGYTDKEHLGIWGRSNGGLLVGAAMTQRRLVQSGLLWSPPTGHG